ncbi:MAG: hypothetical protein ACR2J5_05745 [Geodermatophilaceae bacterium]
MTDFLRSAAREYFDRRHLLAIIGTLFVSLHTVDELVRGEELAPPYIPLLVLTASYPLLPVIVRALAVAALGGIFSIAQIFGHLTPLLDRDFGGSDGTGVYPVLGGAILVGLGIRLVLTMRRQQSGATTGGNSDQTR